MYVKNNMLSKNKLTTLELNESIEEALKKLNKGDFLSLPVVDGDEFKGVLMKGSIYENYFDIACTDKEEYLENTKVKDLYNSKYKSLDENDLIEDASYLLREWRTPFIPVFNGAKEFVGILTHYSIFNAFSEVFGLGKGTRIVVNMFDIPGQLAKLSKIIKKENINILNFAAIDANVLDLYKVVIRVDTDDVDELITKITRAGFKIGEVIKE